MRVLDLGLLLVVTIMLVTAGVGLDRVRVPSDALDLGASCRSSTAAWLDDRGATRPWTQPTYLGADGALLACAPDPGLLRFSMRGDVALGRGAHAVVVHAGETVWNGLVADSRSLELHVAAGDAVMVAFTNDIYRSPGEDRGLWISAVESEPR